MLEIPDVEHLPRKAAGTEWNWPKKKNPCVLQVSGPQGQGCLSPLRVTLCFWMLGMEWGGLNEMFSTVWAFEYLVPSGWLFGEI